MSGVPSDGEAAARAADAFAARFGGAPEGVWAAPGRVNVIGEHTDYNGGHVLPVALPHTTRAAVARRMDTPMPYISSWNQAPVRSGREAWWLHLQLFSFRRAPGKLKYLAGSESGMGAFITDTNPEDVAEQLRNVVLP